MSCNVYCVVYCVKIERWEKCCNKLKGKTTLQTGPGSVVSISSSFDKISERLAKSRMCSDRFDDHAVPGLRRIESRTDLAPLQQLIIVILN